MTLADYLTQQLESLGLSPLTEDQRACLADPYRSEEAAAMVEDLRDRCGVDLTACRERLADLEDQREEWLDAMGRAQRALGDVMGQREEASAQADYSRADAALSAWLTSDDGCEWAILDAIQL